MTTASPASSCNVALDVELRQGLQSLGVVINEAGVRKLISYLSLIGKWNRTYNLTAIREPHQMVSIHLLDSLSVAPILSGRRVLDVGSGAGLPGIPLAIAWPGSDLTLLDSNQKRVAFLRQATSSLELENVSVMGTRVEDCRPLKLFDLIISRAFSQISQFVQSAGHLLAKGGTLAAMKGARPDAELDGIPAGFKVRELRALKVPNLDAERHLVILERS